MICFQIEGRQTGLRDSFRNRYPTSYLPKSLHRMAVQLVRQTLLHSWCISEFEWSRFSI